EFTYGYTDDPAVEAFRAGSESVTFAFGEGLPGRVYESASTEWIPDASSEPTAVFHRAELAADAGLRAAFGVPITADGEVVTVLAFFLRERRERDERLAADVHDVVSGLGGLIERTRTEERVRERNQQLEGFAEVVSHDLRNPLNVATGALSMVADECESEYVETVAAAHERMQELITDVLTLARQGKTVDAPETVALAAVVGDCWETVETGGATLQVETDAEILADRSRLRQLVENLLRNAVDHGGPTVTVTVGSLPTGFYIQDDGPGFGEVDCETVFELGATTADDGTGLGLAIVREIAEAHGWQVEAVDGESGARFEVTGVERR
ncbi:MAG: sensor histidine kinase, partial [Halohasta sp.]